MEIKEIWGNGKDVIIKFTRGFGGVWWAASEWMSVSYNYTPQYLKANGYRRLKWPV